ncbi:MAG: YfhO family protein [Lachnospiraceae bacterium]|nr:YfhO family protein [Lachnospiraceae bacterium]
MNKLNKPKLYPLYAALLAALSFLIGLATIDILGFGNNIILFGDLDEQYIPFIKMFLHAITGKEDYWYSLSLYLGSGTALTYAYYCINPFNLIYLMDWMPVSIATTILITCKIAIAAGTFQHFTANALHLKKPTTILFALCYTLGGFTASMYTNIIWLDAVYLLPVVTYLTMKAAGGLNEEKNGKTPFPFISLTLAFAFLFITNFYIAFMVGVFESLVFVLSFFREHSEKTVKSFLQRGFMYASSVLLAAMLCAAALMPAAYFLYSHLAEDNESFHGLTASIPDIINSLFIGSFPALDNNIPFLYTGLPVLLLSPFFFTPKRLLRRDKILVAILLVYYLLCMLILPLYKFMHVFDYPNWYAYRFSFCISFVLSAISAYTVENLEDINKKALYIYAVSLILLYSAMIPLCAARYKSYQTGNDNTGLVINTVFILLYLFLFMLHRRQRLNTGRKKFVLPVVFSTILVSEIVVNFYITGTIKANPITELAEEQWLTEGDAIHDIQTSDNGLYRISVKNESTSNAPAWFCYAGLNTFSSSDDYNLRRTLLGLGIYSPNRAIFDVGYTPVTYAFVGAKYKIKAYSEKEELDKIAETGAELSDEIVKPEISQYDSYLPLVFMSDDDILDYTASSDPFFNQNQLMTKLSGSEYEFFTPISKDDILEGSYNTIMIENPQVTLFTKKSTLSSLAYYTFVIPHKDSRLFFGCFTQDESITIRDTMYIICDTLGWWETPELQNGNIVPASLLEPTNYRFIPGADPSVTYDEIAIYTNDSGVDTDSCRSIYFYEYTLDDKLKNLCDDLTATAPTITSFSSSDIKATVHVTNDRPILFTTIPYDEGWSIYCDGKEIETISTVENAFLGAVLPEGDHEIELKYTARFAKEGLIISLAGAVILGIISIISLLQRFRRTDSPKNASN